MIFRVLGFCFLVISALMHPLVVTSTQAADTLRTPAQKEGKEAVSRLIAYGWESFNQGQYEDATFFFKKALELSSNNLEALYGLSWTNYKEKRYASAISGFERLFAKGYRKDDCGKALFFLYLNTKEKEKARRFLSYLSSNDKERFQKLLFPVKSKTKVAPKNHVKRQNLPKKKNRKDRLAPFFKYASKKEWQKVIRLYDSLPSRLKARQDVMTVAAWAFFNRGNMPLAKGLFKSLLEKAPQNHEAAYGLALSCFKSRDENCLERLRKGFPQDDRIKELFCMNLSQVISESYVNKKYKNVSVSYQDFKKHGCRDERVDSLAAWSFFKIGQYQEARDIFLKLTKKENVSAGDYQGLIASLRALGEEKVLWHEMARLATSDNAIGQRLAGDFFYKKGLSERAAYVWPDSSTPYFNAHSPSIKAGYNYAYIEGDKGTSRLRVEEVPEIDIHVHPMEKMGFGIGLKNLLLQSGSAGEHPWLGTPAMGNPAYSAKTSVTGSVPYTYVDFQDRIRVKGVLSSTPLGTGLASPVPLFRLDMEKAGRNMGLSLFQRSVTRSILSWVGQRDPYTGKRWGRVLATGLNAHASYGLSNRWWLSFKGGYSHLWGKNTWHNSEISGGFTLGKSLSNGFFDEFSLGLYTFLQHYERNSNFYTYGHGGYFSPQFFLAAGPFFRVVTRQGARWLMQLDAALSYLNYYEKASSFYPISTGAPGKYAANQTSKLGYSLKLALGYLFSSKVMGGVNFSMDRSGDFSQWQAGAAITLFLDSRKGLLKGDIGPRVQLPLN